MFHKFKKTKAAISIFLILIFVPMMTLGSIFVDASRFAMAKAVATSAADLTLNTLLTNYDKQLNEYFGLIASCQDMEQFKSETKDFFVRCITSSGVEASDAENAANLIMGFAEGDQSYSDLLQLALVPEDNSLATEVTDGDLSNASLIKTQIVEFMKYRAPINAVSDFIKSLTKASKTVEDADEIAEMTEKKTEFYEEENELMQLLLDLRNLLIEYDQINSMSYGTGVGDQKYNETLGGTVERMNSRLTNTDVNSFIRRYEAIHTKLVFDIHNTGDLISAGIYKPKTFSSDTNGTALTYKETTTITNEDGSTTTETKEIAKLKESIENAISKLSAFKTASNNFYNDTKKYKILDENGADIYKKQTNSNPIWDAQYLAQSLIPMKNSASFSSFYSAVNNLKTAIADMKATYNAADSELRGTKESINHGNGPENSTLTEHYNQVLSNYGTVKTQFSFYTEIEDRLKGLTTKCLNADNDSIINNSCIIRTVTGNKIFSVYNEAALARNRYNSAKTKAIEIYYKAEEIEGALKTYNESFDDWKTAAYNSELDGYSDPDEMVNVDRNEITNKEQGSYTENDATTAMLGKIKQEDITALKTRFNNIQLLMVDAIDAIDECKYNGTKVTDIKTVDKAISVANISVSSYYESKLLEVPYNFENPALLPAIDATNNTDIFDGQLQLRDDVYEYFKNYIEPDKTKESSEGENAKDEIEKIGEKETDSVKDEGQIGLNGKELKDSANRPSAEGSTIISQDRARENGEKDINNASSFASDLFQNFSGTISQLVVDLRDDLLISDYIMSMFSYDTFENEGKLDYALKERKDFSLSTVSAWETYKKTSLGDIWSDEDKTFKYNKTLRNNMINEANCYSYGNEVEYILYGGTNSKNKASAYSSIYLLRYVFDLPAVFMEFWPNTTVDSIAVSIQAASLGIIPIPLTKLVICLALCAVEAGLDMNAIRTGLGVPLVKGKTNLFCSLPGADDLGMELKYNIEDSNEDTDKIGAGDFYFRYGDYLRFFLIFNLMSSEKEKSICLRTADVIQANMRKISGPDSEFLLSKSQVYYQIDVKVKIEPLMLKLPINANSIGDILEETDEWNTMEIKMVRGY